MSLGESQGTSVSGPELPYLGPVFRLLTHDLMNRTLCIEGTRDILSEPQPGARRYQKRPYQPARSLVRIQGKIITGGHPRHGTDPAVLYSRRTE